MKEEEMQFSSMPNDQVGRGAINGQKEKGE
jgi:hypothetical protein